MTADHALDFISENLKLESWFEGKTLTVMVFNEDEQRDQFIKLRFVGVTSSLTAADLRGEPE